MYLDADDIRPPTALDRVRVDAAQLAGGVVAALGLPGLVVLAVFLFAVAAEAVLGAADEQPAIREMEVIEAEFVRLGKEMDPNRLPDREVPLQATAPDDRVVVSEDPQEPTRERPDAGVPPAHAEVDDLLRNLDAKAHKFAEIAEQRELEGSPDGIRGGTAERATAGSMLGVFFRKGWEVPNVLTAADLQGLVAKARVRLGQDLTVESYELVEPSGNDLFDQSVLDQLQRLQKQNVRVPDAPEDPADRYRGATVMARFRGKDAR